MAIAEPTDLTPHPQKASKQLAAANAQSLRTLHLSSAVINGFFVLYRILYHYGSTTRKTFVLYLLFSGPAFIIQFYLEKLARPRYAPSGELLRTGEDLASKGVMEYMWDVLYITWACLVIVMVFGEKGWWLWVCHSGGLNSSQLTDCFVGRHPSVCSILCILHDGKDEARLWLRRRRRRYRARRGAEQETEEAGKAWRPACAVPGLMSKLGRFIDAEPPRSKHWPGPVPANAF